MSVLIAVLGGLSIISMPKDIFPYIDIPVLSVIWSYNGISPDEMSSRITTVFERGLTTTVNDIEHIESSSYNGVSRHPHLLPAQREDRPRHRPGGRRLPAHPAHPAARHLSRPASSSSTPRAFPSSSSASAARPQRTGALRSRRELHPHPARHRPGCTIPPPYGGKQRQIMVDIDPKALYARGLSATDISNALNNQNLILPSGTAKMGDREYFIHLNSSPTTVSGRERPARQNRQRRRRLYEDVAQVRDGFAVQTNIVREERPPLRADDRYQERPGLHARYRQRHQGPCRKSWLACPRRSPSRPLFDQSLFVSAAIDGVVREGLIAAGLTAS
jgi:hypothetical protein